MNENFMDDLDQTRERRRSKTIQGKTFIFYCEDPYGFWTVSCKEGGSEKLLPGQFTTLAAAERAANEVVNYRAEKKVVSSGFKSDSLKKA